MDNFNRLLLIDDDPISQYISKTILKRLDIGKNIKTAMNGLEAIEYLKKNESENSFPHLIFLDLNMPVMDGFDFLHTFYNLFPDQKSKVKIIILTTSADPLDIKKSHNFSVFTYIYKPLTEEKVKVALSL